MDENTPVVGVMETPRHVKNATYFVVGFLVTFLGYFISQSIVQTIMTGIIEYREPGFSNLFSTLLLEGRYSEITSMMWFTINFSQFLVSIIFIVIAAIVLKDILKFDFQEFKDNYRKYLIYIVVGFVAILVASVVVFSIYEYFEISTPNANQDFLEYALNSNSYVLSLISVVLFVPFIEEIIFRKFFNGMLEKSFNFPRLLTMFVSAIFFAAVHQFNINFFQYLPLALIISYSYYKSDNNIWVPVGIHLLNNGFSLIGIFFGFVR